MNSINRFPERPKIIPDRWADFKWPEWMPTKIRKKIEDFWAEDFGRGPASWLKSMDEQQAPVTGEIGSFRIIAANGAHSTGRFVFCWNNIGRVVKEDGSFDYCSF